MKKLDIGRYSFESPNKAELHEDSLEIVKKVNEIIHWINEQSEPVELPKEEPFKNTKLHTYGIDLATEGSADKSVMIEMIGNEIVGKYELIKIDGKPKETSLRDGEEKWTMNELEAHIKANCNDTYSMAVVLSALYMKLYGKSSLPKIGLSGFQGDAAEQLAEIFPNPSDT